MHAFLEMFGACEANLKTFYNWFLHLSFDVMTSRGGGRFSAKFRVGVCCPQFQNGTVGKTNFCENDSLARLISPSKVP